MYMTPNHSFVKKRIVVVFWRFAPATKQTQSKHPDSANMELSSGT
jgi:hypothetical protein